MRFESELPLRILVIERVLLQDLERHVALKLWILGAEHYAHTAFAQAFNDSIPTEGLTNQVSSALGWGDQHFRVYSPGRSLATNLLRYRRGAPSALQSPVQERLRN